MWQERRQFLMYARPSAAVLVLAIVSRRVNPALFAVFIGETNPVIAAG